MESKKWNTDRRLACCSSGWGSAAPDTRFSGMCWGTTPAPTGSCWWSLRTDSSGNEESMKLDDWTASAALTYPGLVEWWVCGWRWKGKCPTRCRHCRWNTCWDWESTKAATATPAESRENMLALLIYCSSEHFGISAIKHNMQPIN